MHAAALSVQVPGMKGDSTTVCINISTKFNDRPAADESREAVKSHSKGYAPDCCR